MALTIEEVEYVAGLARLGLTDEEKIRLRESLSVILDNIAILNRVDTSAISPTAQVIPMVNVLRDDVVGESLSLEQALSNAPHQADGFFEVLAVMGGDASEEGA